MANNDIIVRNKYYPDGLTEESIQSHYIKYQTEILNETKMHPIVLAIATGTNQYVIRRNNHDGTPIVLSSNNYSKYMNGRTISAFVELGNISNIWHIDIDPGDNVTEKETKDCLFELVTVIEKNLFQKGFTVLSNPVRITSTSTGYHVFIKMARTQSGINNLDDLKMWLYSVPFKKKYLINDKRKDSKQINLDLSVMNRRGSYVIPYALNRNGLMVKDVTKNWTKFQRKDAIIK